MISGKQALERELAEWIAADPARTARWGKLLSELERIYRETERMETLKALFQETLIRGTMIAPTLMRMHNAGEKLHRDSLAQAVELYKRMIREL